MSDITLTPEAEAETARALTLPEHARALTITDAESFQSAGAFLVEIKRRRQAITTAFRPVVEAGLRAHREALALQKQADAPCEQAETITKQAMATWQREQDRIRIEQERQAALERRRLEEESRQRAEAERIRLQREEDERRLTAASEAEAHGDTERAARIIEHVTQVPTPEPEPVIPAPIEVAAPVRADGVSFRTVYRWRLTNDRAVKREYLAVDEKKVNAVVRALGPDAAMAVGGIEVFADTTVAARVR